MRLHNLVARYLNQKDEAVCTGESSPGVETPTGALQVHHSSPTAMDRSSDWRDLLEERAAIMEHDGNIERAEAVRLASVDIRRFFH